MKFVTTKLIALRRGNEVDRNVVPKMNNIAKILLCAVVFATGFEFTKPAQSQTLFEVLFPQAAARRRARFRARQQLDRPVVKIEKIKGPQYYKYRPVAMKRIKLEIGRAHV